MALTANIEREIMFKGYEVSVVSAGTDVFYKGALVNIDASGDLIVAADTASTTFLGIVTEYVSATSTTKVRVAVSDVVVIPLATASQTMMGTFMYATADDTVATSATNVSACGRVVDVVVGVSVTIDMASANTVAFDTVSAG